MIVESYEDRIILSGALRSNFWETIHTAISLALRKSPQGVIIDCSQITECTPEGADTFRSIMMYLQDHDARVIVAEVPEPVMKVLKQVPEVRSQLPIAVSVDAARASLMRLHRDEDEYGRKKKKVERTASTHFLVVLLGGESDSYTLQIACEHAAASGSGLILMYPIVVPLDLPLQAPLESEEGRGEEVLAKAKEYCDAQEIISQVVLERGRDVASTIAETLIENAALQVMIPLVCSDDATGQSSKLVKTVLAKISQPVMFVRSAVDPSSAQSR